MSLSNRDGAGVGAVVGVGVGVGAGVGAGGGARSAGSVRAYVSAGASRASRSYVGARRRAR